MASDVMGRCLKKQTVACEEESGSEFGFKSASTLADEMLLEILIRLPAKCAFRYKAVCKRWCFLISSGYFVRMLNNLQRQRSSKYSPEQFTIVFQHHVSNLGYYSSCRRYNYSQYPLEAVSNHPELSETYKTENLNLNFLVDFTPNSRKCPWNKRFDVKASCDDLLLCSHLETLYVVNVLTKQWIALPPSRESLGKRVHGRGCRMYTQKPGLLCYRDESICNGDGWCSFKVILLPVNDEFHPPHNIREMRRKDFPQKCSYEHNIQIYCSETREWTEVAVDWFRPEWNYYRTYSPLLAHKSRLYWFIGRSIVVLNPFGAGDAANLSVSRVIKLPREFVLIDTRKCFGVSAGRLRIACRVRDRFLGIVIYVWDLKDCRESWLLAHTVVLRELGDEHINSYLIAFHPYKSDKVFFKNSNKIELYNMRTKKLRMYRMLNFDKGSRVSSVITIVPPNLHQWYPTPLCSPLQANDCTPIN